jgi:hypothetical protein
MKPLAPTFAPQQRLDRGLQRRIAGAYLLKVRCLLLRAVVGQALVEDVFLVHRSPRRQTLLPPSFYARKFAPSTRDFLFFCNFAK